MSAKCQKRTLVDHTSVKLMGSMHDLATDQPTAESSRCSGKFRSSSSAGANIVTLSDRALLLDIDQQLRDDLADSFYRGLRCGAASPDTGDQVPDSNLETGIASWGQATILFVSNCCHGRWNDDEDCIGDWNLLGWIIRRFGNCPGSRIG